MGPMALGVDPLAIQSSAPGPRLAADTADSDRAWAALRLAARWSRDGCPADAAISLDDRGAVGTAAAESAAAWLVRGAGGWVAGVACERAVETLVELYLPICNAGPGRPLTVGHLGQSLDGHIATDSGDSNYVTGPANIRHLHRMRALCDAVVVGAHTVATDDPRLTTRLVPGPSPLRVVLDPNRRLDADLGVFNDGRAPTWLVCDEKNAEPGARLGLAEVVGIPTLGGLLDLEVLLTRLRAAGFNAVFVEGGGTTVSAFLTAGLLDRLQITIAPLVTGHGKPGIRLPAKAGIGDCLRPAHRIFGMGDDVMFDCDLRAEPADVGGEALRRIL
jgi:diaminohydroxyphosphoribosylaminopyrimidine deaminase / 5-amino-6-(5-phosphoribosylamino)uracil reductase